MKTAFQSFLFLLVTALVLACSTPPVRTVPAPQVTASTVATPAQLDPPSVLDTQETKPTAPQAPQDKIVRILLGENQTETYVKHSGRVNVFLLSGGKKYKVSQAGTLAVKALPGGQVQVGTLKAAQTIVVQPVKATLEWNNNTYCGSFYILPTENKQFSIIEYVSLEEYLHGVLPYEMSPSWPLEALKAQAVAARTYTLKSLGTLKNKPFDLYSDVRSQVYRGTGKRYENVTRAVDETKGQVLTYQDKMFYTYYHANCGGSTDDVSSWHFSTKSIKPLSGASCKFDSHSKSYTWNMTVPSSKVEQYARTVGLKGTLKSIKIVRKTGTGRATNLTITTSKGSKTVPCGQFRLATGIRSCKITRLSVTTKGVQFSGKGYGHGIGMCQDGAYGMAKQNYNYQQILKHYYPGSTLGQAK